MLLPEGSKPEGLAQVDGIALDEEDIERYLLDLITRTPSIVDKVHSDLPVGFSEKVAEKILCGLLDTAAALQRMPPA